VFSRRRVRIRRRRRWWWCWRRRWRWRCLKLNREKNERLRWVALHGEAEMTEQEGGDAGSMVALRGPMSLGEWMAWWRERGLGVTTMVSGWSVVGV
jgi:hypothetical protein